jgi:hypothetical protein
MFEQRFSRLNRYCKPGDMRRGLAEPWESGRAGSIPKPLSSRRLKIPYGSTGKRLFAIGKVFLTRLSDGSARWTSQVLCPPALIGLLWLSSLGLVSLGHL